MILIDFRLRMGVPIWTPQNCFQKLQLRAVAVARDRVAAPPCLGAPLRMDGLGGRRSRLRLSDRRDVV